MYGVAANIARRVALDALSQWGKKGIVGKGLVKSVDAVAPTIGIGGIAAGAGTEYLEDKYGVNLPEATPNGLLGAGLYHAANTGLVNTTTNVEELVARERLLDEARIRKFEESLKADKGSTAFK